MIDTAGAPHGQGLDQGFAAGCEVHDALGRLRQGRGWLGWRRARRAAHAGGGRAVQRFMPQQHERLQGIADAARVPLAALELGESHWRARAVACFKDGSIDAAFDLPPGLVPHVRRSTPDAGGFPSAELSAAPLASAFAGVNSEGIAALCLEDAATGLPSLRCLVQDVLFRTRTFASAIDHVRRRGAYLVASGRLLVASPIGEAATLEVVTGDVRVVDPPTVALASAATVSIDAAARELRFVDPDGRKVVVRSPAAD